MAVNGSVTGLSVPLRAWYFARRLLARCWNRARNEAGTAGTEILALAPLPALIDLFDLMSANVLIVALAVIAGAFLLLGIVVQLLEMIFALIRTALVCGVVLLAVAALATIAPNTEPPPAPAPVVSPDPCTDPTQPGPCAAVPLPTAPPR